MDENNNRPRLYVVGEKDNPITEIPDDSGRKRADETKRKIARNIKRFDKNRSSNSVKLSPVACGIIVALIFVLVYIVADISSGGFIYTANGRFVSMFADKTSENFSVSIKSDDVYKFDSYKNEIVLLAENGISFIDKSGKVSASQQYSYSSPSTEISGANVVVFDRGNTSFSLMNNKKIYYQDKSDKRIIDFAMSEKSNYAIAVKDEKAKSVLYGYDARGNVIYQWNCPKGYISDVVITPSGGKVAVTVIDAVNAVLCSSVYILDFEYDSAYAQFDYNGETVLGTKFLTNRKVQVVTDRNVYCISGKEQSNSYEYGTSDICYLDFSGRYTAVVTKDSSHDDFYTLSVFGSNGKLKNTVHLEGKVCGVSASDKSIAVLFADKTETYSGRCKLVGTVDNLNHYDDIVLIGNFVYVLSSDSVKKYPAYGSVTNIIVEEETA